MGEGVSWLTWVLGTGFNATTAVIYPDPTVIASSFAWQWVVTGQLIEAMLWRSLNMKHDGPEWNKRLTRMAFGQQMTIPFVFGLAFLLVGGASDSYQMMAVGLLFIYGFIVLAKTRELHPSHETIKKTKDHSRWLDYAWWGEKAYRNFGIFYALFTIVQPLLLIRPASYGLMQASFMTLTGMLARSWVPHSVPAAWSLLASYGPAFNGLFWYIARNHPIIQSRRTTWDWTFL